jgi:hypothetical protein
LRVVLFVNSMVQLHIMSWQLWQHHIVCPAAAVGEGFNHRYYAAELAG